MPLNDYSAICIPRSTPMSGKSSLFDRLFRRLGIINRTSPIRLQPRILGTIVLYHLLALLACIPWLFSWTGVIMAVAGIYVFGTLGINIGFHRLLDRKSVV
jgi:hypothetical protein